MERISIYLVEVLLISIHSNQLYLYGGKNQVTARTCLPGLYFYDIGTQVWSYQHTLGVAPSTLGHSMMCIGDMLYIYGGYIDGIVTDHLYMLSVSPYTEFTWTKLTTTGNVAARCDHSVTAVGSKIYVFGGCGGKEVWLNDLQVFDTDTLCWKELPSSGDCPLPRGCHSLAAHGTKELYVFGGTNDSLHPKGATFNDLYIYDIGKQKWSRPICRGPACTERYGHTAIISQSRMFIMFGINNHGEVCDLGIAKLTRKKRQKDDKHSKSSVESSSEEKKDSSIHKDTDPPQDLSTLKTDAREALDKILKSLDDKSNQLERERRDLANQRKALDAEKASCEQKLKELNSKTQDQHEATKEWLDLRERHNKKDRENIEKQRKSLLGV